MIKIKDILNIIKQDHTFKNIRNISLNDQISIVRSNDYCKQLIMLARNSAPSVVAISECIMDLSSDINNDFRIFSLLLVLSDAGVDEAIELSRVFAQSTDLSSSKLIAINILLKESLYGKHN